MKRNTLADSYWTCETCPANAYGDMQIIGTRIPRPS
jgi:hypothetical protein